MIDDKFKLADLIALKLHQFEDVHPQPYNPHPTPETRNPKPETRIPDPRMWARS